MLQRSRFHVFFKKTFFEIYAEVRPILLRHFFSWGVKLFLTSGPSFPKVRLTTNFSDRNVNRRTNVRISIIKVIEIRARALSAN